MTDIARVSEWQMAISECKKGNFAPLGAFVRTWELKGEEREFLAEALETLPKPIQRVNAVPEERLEFLQAFFMKARSIAGTAGEDIGLKTNEDVLELMAKYFHREPESLKVTLARLAKKRQGPKRKLGLSKSLNTMKKIKQD